MIVHEIITWNLASAGLRLTFLKTLKVEAEKNYYVHFLSISGSLVGPWPTNSKLDMPIKLCELCHLLAPPSWKPSNSSNQTSMLVPFTFYTFFFFFFFLHKTTTGMRTTSCDRVEPVEFYLQTRYEWVQ